MNDIATPDIFAALWFAFCWAGYALFAEIMSQRTGNLLVVMNEYRLQWMRQMMKRDNRMVDAALIGNLLRSIAFFASTTIFILLGLFTMLRYRQEASGILGALPFSEQHTPPLLWEAKIFLLVIIFVYAFFKYTWSLRQYNYASIVVGSAPPASERSPYFEEFARNAARLIGNAAKHFNMGLRAYYFGLAVLFWFLNPFIFTAATAWVVLVLWRREFHSQALKYMINPVIFRAQE